MPGVVVPCGAILRSAFSMAVLIQKSPGANQPNVSQELSVIGGRLPRGARDLPHRARGPGGIRRTRNKGSVVGLSPLLGQNRDTLLRRSSGWGGDWIVRDPAHVWANSTGLLHSSAMRTS